MNPRWNPTTARPTFSGSAMAQFLGTSSPNTICTAVASTNAAVKATTDAVSSGRPTASIGTCRSAAIEGSAMKPTTRLVMVMPSCAPDNCVDMVRSASRSDFAFGGRLGEPRHRRAVHRHERELGGHEHGVRGDQRQHDQDQQPFDDHRLLTPAHGLRD